MPRGKICRSFHPPHASISAALRERLNHSFYRPVIQMKCVQNEISVHFSSSPDHRRTTNRKRSLDGKGKGIEKDRKEIKGQSHGKETLGGAKLHRFFTLICPRWFDPYFPLSLLSFLCLSFIPFYVVLRFCAGEPRLLWDWSQYKSSPVATKEIKREEDSSLQKNEEEKFGVSPEFESNGREEDIEEEKRPLWPR